MSKAALLLSSNGAVQVGDLTGVFRGTLQPTFSSSTWTGLEVADVWQMFPREFGILMCPTTVFSLCSSFPEFV